MALVSFFMCARTDEGRGRRADGATFSPSLRCALRPSQIRHLPRLATGQQWAEYNTWKRITRNPISGRCAAA